MENQITFHIEGVLSKLNTIESSWNGQFDIAPHTPIRFSASEAGILQLNDVCLGIPVSEVDTESIFVDVEYFGFRLRNAESCEVHVCWPYNGVPALSFARHTYSLRPAN